MLGAGLGTAATTFPITLYESLSNRHFYRFSTRPSNGVERLELEKSRGRRAFSSDGTMLPWQKRPPGNVWVLAQEGAYTMRRTFLLLAVVAAVLTVASGVALAKGFVGTPRGERIAGTPKADTINARGGKDEVRALQGADRINAGIGNDRVYGGRGNDNIQGGGGHDVVRAGQGDDKLRGGHDEDKLYGGLGKDVIETGRGFKDLVDCGSGVDTAYVDRKDRVVHCENVK
jgi:Ca2+-binding RTX toxin-like protein